MPSNRSRWKINRFFSIFAAYFLTACGLQDMVVDPIPVDSGLPAGVKVPVLSLESHGCVINDKKLACWGYNFFRQLGRVSTKNCKDGNLECEPTPCLVQNVGKTKSVYTGGNSTCAVDENNNLWCWGHAGAGQLGDEPNTRCDSGLNSWPCYQTPTRIKGIDQVQKAAVSSHICLIDGSNRLWCWGANNSGQLGRPSQDQCRPNYTPPIHKWGEPVNEKPFACSRKPMRVPGIEGVVDVAVGLAHTCAVTMDGGVYCWGSNQRGQAGGHARRYSAPHKVSGVKDVVGVTASFHTTCVWQRDGQALCFGHNGSGQLGYQATERCAGSTTCSRTPHVVLNNVVQVDVGFTHACARHNNGTVSCWGADAYDQLGYNIPGPCDNKGRACVSPPKPFPSIKNATTLAVGHNASCVIEGKKVRCWGRNEIASLGDGTTQSRITPRSVSAAKLCE